MCQRLSDYPPLNIKSEDWIVVVEILGHKGLQIPPLRLKFHAQTQELKLSEIKEKISSQNQI